MSTIGNSTSGVVLTLSNGAAYAHNIPADEHLYIPIVDQNVDRIELYQGAANTGNNARIAVYDMSSGANGAVIVGEAQTFTGTGVSDIWIVVNLAGADMIFLEAGKTYGLAIWSDGWKADVSGGWQSNNNIIQYGLSDVPVTFVASTNSYSGGAIAMYANTIDASTPVLITAVNTGSSIADGDPNVPVDGSEFGATQGAGDVIISAGAVDDVGAVVQEIVSWADTQIVINATLPTIVIDTDPVLVYVKNNLGEVSASYSVAVTPAHAATLFTAVFEELSPAVVAAGAFDAVTPQRYEILVPGTTDFTLIGAADSAIGTRFTATGVGAGTGTATEVNQVICESNLGFDIGVAAYINRVATPAVVEVATEMTTLNSLPTATPQYYCVFPNGPPVAGDVIQFHYLGNGDIRSVTGQVELPSGAIIGEVCP